MGPLHPPQRDFWLNDAVEVPWCGCGVSTSLPFSIQYTVQYQDSIRIRGTREVRYIHKSNPNIEKVSSTSVLTVLTAEIVLEELAYQLWRLLTSAGWDILTMERCFAPLLSTGRMIFSLKTRDLMIQWKESEVLTCWVDNRLYRYYTAIHIDKQMQLSSDSVTRNFGCNYLRGNAAVPIFFGLTIPLFFILHHDRRSLLSQSPILCHFTEVSLLLMSSKVPFHLTDNV